MSTPNYMKSNIFPNFVSAFNKNAPIDNTEGHVQWIADLAILFCPGNSFVFGDGDNKLDFLIIIITIHVLFFICCIAYSIMGLRKPAVKSWLIY